jgi:hypothetical protein
VTCTPTAITLSSLTATTPGPAILALPLAALLLALGVVAFFLRRRTLT